MALLKSIRIVVCKFSDNLHTKDIINFPPPKYKNHDAALHAQDWYQVQLQHHSVGLTTEEFCNFEPIFYFIPQNRVPERGCDNPLFEAQTELK